MATEFVTTEYVRSHGKLPKGRGSWAFVQEKHLQDHACSQNIFWANGTLSEAKKAAKEHFQDCKVYILP